MNSVTQHTLQSRVFSFVPKIFIVFTLVFILLFSVFAFSPTSVNAEGSTGSRSMKAKPWAHETYTKAAAAAGNGETNGVGTGILIFNSGVFATSTGLIGTNDPDLQQQMGPSAVGTMGNAMAGMISNPPASAQVWLADTFSHSPLIPQAYAQGIGFKSLSPILPVWKAFRDVSYVFFVIAFIVIGFMIMFRQKLGGQTAVTVMSALPNLVITLILITFSYAIAGLVIDVMYLAIYLVVGVFKTQQLLPATITAAGGPGTTKQISLEEIALGNNIFFNGIQLVFGNGTNSAVSNSAKSVGAIVQGFFVDGGALAGIASAVGWGADVIAYLVFAVAIFFAVTKTFFQLLVSYVTFIISVIFSPFMLMIGAFTGKQDFWQWLKNLIGTLAPFPVVVTMILLAMVLAGQSKTPGVGFSGGDGGVGFQAPQITLSNSAQGIAAVQGLIAIGILMLIPEAVKLAREWVGAKNPFEKYIADIGQNLKKGWSGGEVIPGFKATSIGGAGDLILGTEKSRKWTEGLGGIVGGGLAGVPQRAGAAGIEYGKKQIAASAQRAQAAPTTIEPPPTPTPAANTPQPAATSHGRAPLRTDKNNIPML